MTERTKATTRVTAAGLFAGVAGWAAAGQSPPAFDPPSALPIPELPRAAAPTPARIPETAEPTPLPRPAAAPPLAPPAALPSPTNAAPPAQSDFNLRTDPVRHSLTGDAISRESLPTPTPAFAEIPPPALPAFPPMPHPETAAMRLDKALYATAIGAALAGGPALARDGQDDKTKIPLASGSVSPTDPKKEIDEKPPTDLKKEVEAVRAMLETLTAKQKQLGDAVLGKGEGFGAEAGLAKKIDDLSTTLKTLDEAVKKLDDKMTKLGESVEKNRTSLSSPLTNKDTTKTSSGIVKLINGYGERVSMVVNGTTYRLEPGETKDVNVPAGVFDYALPLAGGEVKKSQVKDNEIVTLRIK
jgi:uncharacterized protein YoxC